MHLNFDAEILEHNRDNMFIKSTPIFFAANFLGGKLR